MAIENIVQAKVTGFGNDRVRSEKFTETRTPTEIFEGYAVIGDTSANLDIGGIANSLVQGLWIKCESDGIYYMPNNTLYPVASDLIISTAGLYIPEGAVNFISWNSAQGINSDIAAIPVLGTASTAAVSYLVYGTTT